MVKILINPFSLHSLPPLSRLLPLQTRIPPRSATTSSSAAAAMVKTDHSSGSSSEGGTPSPSSSPTKGSKKKLSGDDGIDRKVAEGERAASPVEGNDNSVGGQPEECELSAGSQKPTMSWGRLLSQSSQTPHVDLYLTSFTVGYGLLFNLCLDARWNTPNAGEALCKLNYSKSAGTTVTMLGTAGGKGGVKMNGKIGRNKSTKLLNGDELIFGNDGRHAYIFQKTAESHGSPSEEIRHETWSGELPAEAASALASLFSLPDQSDGDVKPGLAPSEVKSGGDVLKAQEGQRGLSKDVSLSSTLQPSSKCQIFKDRLQQAILSDNDIEVSFDSFPYYLSQNTKNMLVNCIHIHLKCPDYAKHTSGLSSVSPRILFSGPAGSEIYQETLVKALAKHYGVRVLIVDSLSLSDEQASKDSKASEDSQKTDNGPYVFNAIPREEVEAIIAPFNSHTFKAGDRVKYVGPLQPSGIPRSLRSQRGPSNGFQGKVILTFPDNGASKVGVRFDKYIPDGNDLGGRCEEGLGFFCLPALLRPEPWIIESAHKRGVCKLLEVVCGESEKGPLILFMKDIEKLISGNADAYSAFKHKLENLPDGVVVIGSHTQADSSEEESKKFQLRSQRLSPFELAIIQTALLKDNVSRLHERTKEPPETMKQLGGLFPNKVPIQPPQEEALLSEWKQQLERDVETLTAKSNIVSIQGVLNRTKFDCSDLEAVSIKEQTLTNENAEKVVGWAVSHYFMSKGSPLSVANDAKFTISKESILHGLDILQKSQNDNKSSKKSLKDVVTENEFEKKLLDEVISPRDIGVTFDDIGALEYVKDTLKELVMLPLQRPELFCKGQLTKPCKGILLFGPPGTGKTMLAKAVATEAGANFINISTSSIDSKSFGEGKSYVRALFSLASKIAPSVIFVEEVDSMLGKTKFCEMKNEFMINWDGLWTKDKERVVVLASTNRPFDLDEAVIRRLPRRFMVDLPNAANRSNILRVILVKENLAPDVDLDVVANMTVGYSGSDLKNLCLAAAHRPLKDLLDKEQKERNSALAENQPLPPNYGNADLRPLSMDDLRYARDQVAASVTLESCYMKDLIQWNETNGEGGSRKKEFLSYFM